MAINIKMTNQFRFTNPQVLQNPAAYVIELSQNEMRTPTGSNHITSDASSGSRLGGPGSIKIRPDESFTMLDEQFSILVSSSQQGDGPSSDFISTLIYLVNNKTLEVNQNAGAPMTANQIYHFTA